MLVVRRKNSVWAGVCSALARGAQGRGAGTFDAEGPKSAEAERLARLKGAYCHLATKADLANLETRLTTWFAGLLLLVVINVLGTVTGILIALLG